MSANAAKKTNLDLIASIHLACASNFSMLFPHCYKPLGVVGEEVFRRCLAVANPVRHYLRNQSTELALKTADVVFGVLGSSHQLFSAALHPLRPLPIPLGHHSDAAQMALQIGWLPEGQQTAICPLLLALPLWRCPAR